MNLLTLCVLAVCMVCGCFATKATLKKKEFIELTCTAGATFTFNKGETALKTDSLPDGIAIAGGVLRIDKEKIGALAGDYTCTTNTQADKSDKVTVAKGSASSIVTSAIIIPLCMLVTSLV